ncbi:MAG: hypothetical protein WBE03_10890 [Terracidiphilus sp.]
MKNYTIFADGAIDESRPDSAPTFQIAICPFCRSASVMATKECPTKEALAIDLRKYRGFTDAGIEAYVVQHDLRQALVHPLSDDVAAHFGWQ